MVFNKTSTCIYTSKFVSKNLKMYRYFRAQHDSSFKWFQLELIGYIHVGIKKTKNILRQNKQNFWTLATCTVWKCTFVLLQTNIYSILYIYYIIKLSLTTSLKTSHWNGKNNYLFIDLNRIYCMILLNIILFSFFPKIWDGFIIVSVLKKINCCFISVISFANTR